MNPVAEIIQSGESERTALVPPHAELDTLGKTVCGILNQQGGRVLWGIDSHGAVAGVAEAETKARELNAHLMQSLVRRPLLSVSVEEFKGKKLVLVEIPPGADKPYSFDRKIWVRMGRQNLRATEDETAVMIERSATRESPWGRDLAPGFDLFECDGRELEDARREIARAGRFGIDVPTTHEELLRRLYLMTSGQLTNAAMVLFASDPLEWSPNVGLRIISYGAGKQGKTLHEQTMHGPAVKMLRQAVTIIQQQTGFTGRFKTGRLEREDRPAYALFALREGLVNAMVHRDYEAISGQLRVEIFPDRLVIQNPGRLPEGWTEKDITRKEESHPTNPDIARVFYLRELMERLGLGGRKLVEACRELKAKPPVWKAADGVVSLTLYRAPRLDGPGQIIPRQAKVLRSLKQGADFKADDYAEAAGVSIRQARRDLSELEELGLVERLGKGPATAYRRTRGVGHA
jgi:ATP-dependent DNA helicase RecG